MRNVFVSAELLGTGYEFKCKKCKYSYPIHLGIEMMYPKVSLELLQDIISSKRYGVKALALRQDCMPDLNEKTKALSDKNLTKCTAVVWGDETYP